MDFCYFQNTANCISNNGHISEFFSVESGVLQGCPIASLLFVLSVELVSCKIRQLIHTDHSPTTMTTKETRLESQHSLTILQFLSVQKNLFLMS